MQTDEAGATWDSVTADVPPPAPTADGAEAVAEAITPEPQTAEPTAESQPEPPTGDAAAISGDPEREGQGKAEAAPDEDEQDEQVDPPEVQALPSRSAARRQARREYVERLKRDAELTTLALDTEQPISKFGETFESLSGSRYSEFVLDVLENHKDQFIDRHGDDLARKMFDGLTVEEVRARLNGSATEQPAATTTTEDGYDPYNDPTQPEEVLAKLRRADELERKFGEIEGKVKTFEQKEQERAEALRTEQARTIENDLFSEVFPVVGEAVKDAGLEVKPDDSDIIKGLKEAAAELLVGGVDPIFESDAENAKAVKRAKEFASRLERDNAFREADALKVRARAAAEKARELPRVKALLEAIQIVADYKAQKLDARSAGQPPVPTVSAGGAAVPPRDITSWDQAIAGAGH